MAQTRPSPTLSRGFTRLGRFLAPYGDPPVVLVAGSGNRQATRFFSAAVEACHRLGCRGMLLTRYAEQCPQRLPPGVRHFDYAPLSHVLPRPAALVHHGGIGTAAQGLASGRPQLVMPMTSTNWTTPVGWCGWASLGSCGPVSSTVLPWPER